MSVQIYLWLVILSLGLLCNLGLSFVVIRRINTLSRTPASSGPASLESGVIAPSFYAETLEGSSISLEAFKGRSFALIFFRPSCEPCREELPSYEAVVDYAREAGVDLVLVSIADAGETRAFFAETTTKLLVVIAPRTANTLSHDYQIAGTPTFCLVDAAGQIVTSGYTSDAFGEWRQITRAWRMSRSSLATAS